MGRVLFTNDASGETGTADASFASIEVGAYYFQRFEASTGCSAEDAAVMFDGIRSILSGSAEQYRHEYEWTIHDIRRWFEAIVVPVEVDIGRGAVILHIDTTERRKIGDQLAEAQRMETVGKLTGGIAHDFNNLLTIIHGSAQLLQHRLPGETTENTLLRAIRGAAERGAGLTSQLLAFSRRQTLVPSQLKPVDVLETLRDLIGRTLRENITLRIDAPASLPSILADEAQLQNALINLIFNASDAMPDGGKVEISCKVVPPLTNTDRPADPPAEFVRFEVTDNGPGMTPEVLSSAFEPFFTTKGVGKGTGLGLSMVYGFAHQSGGAASIRSELGQGTSVSIDLPVGVGVERSESHGEPLGPHFRKDTCRVLIAEDEPDLRTLLAMMLDSFACDVVEAKDGTQALDLLENDGRIDLVISDVVMPGRVSGYQLLSHIRTRHPSLPVILMTGHADPDMTEQMHDFDPDAVVMQKPFDVAKLRELVVEAVGWKGSVSRTSSNQ